MFMLALNTSALFAYIYRAGDFMSSGLATTVYDISADERLMRMFMELGRRWR